MTAYDLDRHINDTDIVAATFESPLRIFAQPGPRTYSCM